MLKPLKLVESKLCAPFTIWAIIFVHIYIHTHILCVCIYILASVCIGKPKKNIYLNSLTIGAHNKFFLPFLWLAVVVRGFPLRGNHSLIWTPSGCRAVEKMMGSHLLSEKK